MKNITIFFVVLIFIAAGIAAYLVYADRDTRIYYKQIDESTEQNSIDPITYQVNRMSLEEKIGQMLIVGFENKYLDNHIRQMIEQYHIGGINLLKRNVEGRSQVKQLITDLQNISTIPLFIATDQEGGRDVRFNFLEELTPQIKIEETQEAESIAFNRAKELKELGVNMNFSPVLDYVPDSRSYLYNRTFGTDPNTIGSLGNAMLKGYMAGGVLPVVKHFPGYGNVSIDPHTNQAVLNIDFEELELNLIPFRQLIKNNPFAAIMTAHIIIPIIDSKPATLSSKFLTEILREQMGLKGVIITDDIEMVSAGSSIKQSAIESIKAGADIIISTYTPERQTLIFNSLKKAVLNGEITQERINESLARILTLKSVLFIQTKDIFADRD